MTQVFVKKTVEQLIGGNLGILGFEYLSELAAGTLLTDPTPTNKALVKTLVKGLGGASLMMFSPNVGMGNNDVQNVALGAGAGPLMTLGNDWYQVFKGEDVESTAARSARSMKGGVRSRSSRRSARSVGPIITPVRPTGVATRSLALEV